MDNLIENLAKLLGLLLAFVGVNKYLTKDTREKLKSYEERLGAIEEEKLDVKDCEKLQKACPVAVRLSGVEKQSEGMTAWLIRVEAKLDRLLEKVYESSRLQD